MRMRFGAPRRLGVLVSAIAGLLVMAREAQGITIHVPAGGNLQAAIDQAQGGDVITLAAGAVYAGNFWLRNKPGVTVPIVIRTATPDAALPGAGVRMTPAYAPLLAKIRSSNTMPALRTSPGAHHWTVQFLEFLANVNGYGDIISLGAGDTTQTDLSTVPYSLVLDHLYIHGDPLLGQKRGIALHSRDTFILNSYISDCKGVGQDTQAISGFNGPGNFHIENNYLEGAGENFMLGGADPTIPNLIPTHVVFRRNHLYKPVEWRNPIVPTPQSVAASPVAGGGTLPAGTYAYRVVARRLAGQTNQAYSAASGEVSSSVGAGGAVRITWQPVPNAQEYLVYGRTAGAVNTYWTTTATVFTDTGAAGTAGTPGSGTRWVAKNLFELKSGQDIVVEGNVFENNWVGDQSGYAIALTPRNQNGSAPWTVLQRVTFRNNLVRHTAGGVNILGRDNLQPSQRTNNISIDNNLWEDLTPTWGAGSRFLIIGDGPDAITVNHNTILTTHSSIVWLYGGPVGSPTAITNSRYTNNMSAHMNYGIMGQNYTYGQATISAYLPNGVVTRNVLAGGPASSYPAGNYFPTTAAWESGFMNYAAGDYRLAASSPYRNAASDGTDIGANIGAITAHTTIALSGNNSGAVPCAYTVSPTTQTMAAVGGNASVSVSTTSGCAWTAAANQSWVSVTSGASGSGNGPVAYTVAPNTTTTARTATLTVAGRAVTVTQGAGCSYTVSPTTIAVPGAGGSATLTVTTTAGCSWTASGGAAWISVSPASGSGSGSVTLTIAASSQSTARSSTATVAGRTVTVTQGGVMSAPTGLIRIPSGD